MEKQDKSSLLLIQILLKFTQFRIARYTIISTFFRLITFDSFCGKFHSNIQTTSTQSTTTAIAWRCNEKTIPCKNLE
jgi:hypothetical protein